MCKWTSSTNWLKTSDDLGGSPHPQDMVATDRASSWEKQQNFLKFNELNQTSRPCTAGDRQKNAARGREKKSCSGEEGRWCVEGGMEKTLERDPKKGRGGKGDGEETLQRPRERAPQKPPPRPHRGRRCEQFCFLFWRFLETACCFISHDSSWCACQMLITECVTSHPEACYIFLKKLDWHWFWTARTCSPCGRIFFLYCCPRILLHGVIRVSLLTSYRMGSHAAFGKCVVTSKNWLLSLRTVRYVLASPRTVETSFSAAPVLWWLCAGNICRRIYQSCPSRRHSFDTLSSSICRTPSLRQKTFTPQVTYPLGCCRTT